MKPETDNLELAAWLVSIGHEISSTAINDRGHITFTFHESAERDLTRYLKEDVAIPSLKEFSNAHRRLRGIITYLRKSKTNLQSKESKGTFHYESRHRI